MPVINFLNNERNAVQNFFTRQRPTKELNEIGIGGFTLLANVSETVNTGSQVPLTYLEDGSYVQDHIIIEPTVLTISGAVSDINLRASQFDNLLEQVQSTLGITEIYANTQTVYQIQQANSLISEFSNEVEEINRILSDGEQILDFFGLNLNTGAKTSQELFLDAMEAIHFGKQLITIQMPYRNYENMRIISTAVNKTNVSDQLTYNITAMEVRVVNTEYTQISAIKNPTSNLNGQAQDKVSNGNQTGNDVTEENSSLLFDLIGF